MGSRWNSQKPTNCLFRKHIQEAAPEEADMEMPNWDQIQNILSSNREKFQDISIVNSFKISSDHRVLRV